MTYPNATRRNRRRRGTFTPALPYTTPPLTLRFDSVTVDGTTFDVYFETPFNQLLRINEFAPANWKIGTHSPDSSRMHGGENQNYFILTFTGLTAGVYHCVWPATDALQERLGAIVPGFTGDVEI